MVADKPCGEFYDFYSVSREYFGYHHVTSVLQIEAAGCSKILVPGSSHNINLNILFTAVRTYKSPVLKLAF
jgi:hypothetical protein